MGHATEDEINKETSIILSLGITDALQYVPLIFKKSIENDDFLYPIRIGLVLRKNDKFNLADHIFNYALNYDNMRKYALYELAFSNILQSNIGNAIFLLKQLSVEFGLTPQQMIVLAMQYARLGLHQEAIYWSKKANEEDPGLYKEAVTTFQFCLFVNDWPEARALNLLETIEENFALSNIDVIESDIIQALKEKKPYLLLRMGDGEGSHIRINLEDESKYYMLYRENRKEFLDIWFKDQSIIENNLFDTAIARFNEMISLSDCIGAINKDLIAHEYRIGSKRGIPYIVNIMRKMCILSEQRPEWSKQVRISGLTVHYDLLFSGALDRILRRCDKLGLICCHPELPDALVKKYGFKQIDFYKIPGEQIHSEILGLAATRGSHWPTRYLELCRELEDSNVEGELFLVAAGLLGKIYASILKRRGAIVIDVGAVADIWAGKTNTRSFPLNAEGFSLV
ncbi:hypothetical protein [Beijerinckia mobilis]|uniref:hypothetical protein n=1 Tax=Beijerinckia mobilis TaxID=231434 RepID=UPI00054F0F01|nr:hypothetical protein [Beijerinckia mobilis]